MGVGRRWMRRKAGDTEVENERVGRINVLVLGVCVQGLLGIA